MNNRRIASLLSCLLFFLVHSVAAQNVLLPGKVEAHEIEGGKAQTYSLELKDGDYASISLPQQGKLNITVLRPDRSVMRRFPEPLEDADKQYAFVAEGSGTYSIRVANPETQSSKYELRLDKVLSMNARLQAPTSWIDPNPSPRIEALRQQILRDHVGTGDFWKQVAKEGTPLVEPFGSNGKYQLVTFLWRATYDTRNVLVLGSLAVPNLPRTQYVMHRLDNTDVWYWTVKLPAGARFSYHLSPNDSPNEDQRSATAQSDPLNAHRVECLPTSTRFACRSLAELPGAPPQPWLVKNASTPQGKVEMFTVHSEIQKFDRLISIYTPAGYRSDGPLNRLLMLFDGDEYLSPTMNIRTTMDNLIAAHRIPPTVVVLVFNPDGKRLKELVANPEFADSMAKEVVPWVWVHYSVAHDATQTVVGGYSAGGLAANYLALRYSSIFGNVISQSGAVWWSPEQGIYDRDPMYDSNWLARQFAASPRLPVKFYIEAGLFEIDLGGTGGDILEASRELRDVLQAKGNDVHFHQFAGGHDALTWPGTIADALIELLGR
ncbi:alpha/beta hydrolase-fold protein [Acidicapsa ligni]|uniref:alpha/beta hydrolase-fold protein n=1 Tax=Acidicapsa ligni TaxID=542300 RepID=UPI0021DF9413|nr:alpha/beta hydrolase-fold protein [Acidicapsa ligni]